MLSRSTKRVARCAWPSLARSLWRSSTALSTSPSALAHHVAGTPASGSSLTVLAISKNMPPALVELIRAALSSPTSTTIGCLSEVLPSATASALGLDASASETYSVAVASYHPDTPSQRAVPFLSTLQGRPTITLGREHKAGPRSDSVGDSSDEGFEAFLSGKRWGFGEDSRKGAARGIDELVGVPVDSVKEVICFSSDRSQPFMKSLASYPAASTLGLLGSLTPFHSPSGLTYSLFQNASTVSTGAVGVAIVDSAAPARPLAIEYAGLEPLAEPFEVTSASGNIVLTLANQNAARLLLHAVQTLPTSNLTDVSSMYRRQEEKEKEFFAAVFEEAPGDILDLSKARHVSKIMAGDPSRGAMSVETEEEVKTGYHLVFLHRPSPTPVVPALLATRTPSSLTFLSLAPSYHEPNFGFEGEATAPVVVADGFVAASENGVVLSRRGADGGVESWVCSNEGATVMVGN